MEQVNGNHCVVCVKQATYIAFAVVTFPLQNSPEAPHGTIVNAMSHTGHALRHSRLLELLVKGSAGVLEPSVTVEQGTGVRIGLYSLVKGIENPYRKERCKNHLLQYLWHLKNNGVDVMLVGEAPGYRGCALTGIPFTDEVQLKLPENAYALGNWKRSSSIGNTVERSVSAVWPALREYHIIPLMWNPFPFHPYQKGNKASNRTPTQSEL